MFSMLTDEELSVLFARLASGRHRAWCKALYRLAQDMSDLMNDINDERSIR